MAYNSENAANALVARTGAVYAKKGTATTAITSGDSVIPGTFDELGYLTGDGITMTINADNEERYAWQDGDLLRTIRRNGYVEFTMSFAESTQKVLEFVHDSTQTAGALEIDPGKTPGRYELIIHILDRETDKIIRLWAPSVQVVSNEDITFSSEEIVSYGVTIRAYPALVGGDRYAPVTRFDTSVTPEED